MPTYEYRCPKGHLFEVHQRISDEPGAPCPECGRPAQRQISAGAGFLFKGDGFYVTDYRSPDYKKKAASEGTSGQAASGQGSSGEASSGSSTPGDKGSSPSSDA